MALAYTAADTFWPCWKPGVLNVDLPFEGKGAFIEQGVSREFGADWCAKGPPPPRTSPLSVRFRAPRPYSADPC